MIDEITHSVIIKQPYIDALIAEAVAIEREECAKIALDFWCDAGANEIRKRGQK